MVLDQDMLIWLKRRKIVWRKTKKKIHCPRLNRPVWEVFIHFDDVKAARYFVVSWC